MLTQTIATQFYERLRNASTAGEREQALALLAPDVCWNVATPVNTLTGRDAFWREYWQPLQTALPDLEYRPFIMVEGVYENETWINSTGYFLGTFAAPLFGIPPTGKTLYLRFGELLRVRDGKIAAGYVIPDFIAAMEQAGVSPLRPSLGHGGLVPPPATLDGVTKRAQDATQTRKSEALVEAMLAGLLRYDGASLLSMNQEAYWHPHFMWYGPAGIGATRGLAGFRAHHQGPFLQAFPNRTVHATTSWNARGNYVATGGWPNMKATHTGDGWLGLPASGATLTLRVMDFWRREGDRLRENWVSIDIPHMLLQMGHDVFQCMREGRKLPNG